MPSPTITAPALAAFDERLVASHQVRFTAPQDQLLRELARASRRPISAVIRDAVVCWAAGHVNDAAALADQSPPIDVRALVDELNGLAEIEAEQ